MPCWRAGLADALLCDGNGKLKVIGMIGLDEGFGAGAAANAIGAGATVRPLEAPAEDLPMPAPATPISESSMLTVVRTEVLLTTEDVVVKDGEGAPVRSALDLNIGTLAV